MIVISLACSGKPITLYDVSFLLHYLDDFHTLGPPTFPICQRNLDTWSNNSSIGGFPLTLTSWSALPLSLLF